MTPADASPVLVRNGRAMASSLRLSLFGVDEAGADRAWDVVAGEFAAAEHELSRYRADSSLSGLNRAGEVRAPRRLRAALVAAHRAWRLTGGRFDPRVICILEQWGDRAFVPSRPSPVAVGRESWLELGRAGVVRSSAPLDLGGIGKGLTLRWALRALERAGVEADGMSLDAGGDIVVAGTPGLCGAWHIGVEDPDRPDRPLAILRLPGRSRPSAIATSSRAVRHWRARDGSAVHHLVDPRTGRSGGRGLVSVTVVADDPAWAEVWSKTLFLAGLAGVAAEAGRRDLAALWVADDRDVGWSATMTERANPLALPRPALARSAVAT